MKMLRTFLLLLFCSAIANGAQTNLIYFDVGDYGQAIEANVNVTITLISPNPRVEDGIFIRRDAMTSATSTNGRAFFTNLLWGYYRADVAGKAGTTFYLNVWTNTTGTVNAGTLRTNAAALPPDPSTNYYTMNQVDLLIAGIDTSGGTATNVLQVGTTNSSGIIVGTNSLNRDLALDTSKPMAYAATSGTVTGTVNVATYAATSGTVTGTVNVASYAATSGTVTGTVNVASYAATSGTVTGTVNVASYAATSGTVTGTVDVATYASSAGSVTGTVNVASYAALSAQPTNSVITNRPVDGVSLTNLTIGGTALLWWDTPLQPSARHADGDTFGPPGHLNGESCSYSEWVGWWEYLRTNYQNITRSTLGSDASGTNSLYAYIFAPPTADRTVIVEAGLNGQEVSAVYGLWRVFYEMQTSTTNAALNYARERVRWVVVPVASPCGFQGKSGVNSAGVNLSRNFGWRWVASVGGGAAKEDQPETQILTNLWRQYSDAVGFLDCHDTGDSAGKTFLGYAAESVLGCSSEPLQAVIRRWGYGTNSYNIATDLQWATPINTIYASNGIPAYLVETTTNAYFPGPYLSTNRMTWAAKWIGNALLSIAQQPLGRGAVRDSLVANLSRNELGFSEGGLRYNPVTGWDEFFTYASGYTSLKHFAFRVADKTNFWVSYEGPIVFYQPVFFTNGMYGATIYGNQYKTNAHYFGPSGAVISNAVGSVSIASGNVIASGAFYGNGTGVSNVLAGYAALSGQPTNAVLTNAVSTPGLLSGTNGLYIAGNSNATNALAFTKDGLVVSNAVGSVTMSSGKVGINTNTPAVSLAVNGSLSVIDGTFASGKTAFTVASGQNQGDDLSVKFYSSSNSSYAGWYPAYSIWGTPKLYFPYDGQVRWSGDSSWENALTTDIGIGRDSAGLLKITDGNAGDGSLKVSNLVAKAGMYSTNGTRQFLHTSGSTIITNTATLTGSTWGDASEQAWFNGTAVKTLSKSNGNLMISGRVDQTSNQLYVWPSATNSIGVTNANAAEYVHALTNDVYFSGIANVTGPGRWKANWMGTNTVGSNCVIRWPAEWKPWGQLSAATNSMTSTNGGKMVFVSIWVCTNAPLQATNIAGGWQQ